MRTKPSSSFLTVSWETPGWRACEGASVITAAVPNGFVLSEVYIGHTPMMPRGDG
jgi:hypothetical protein